MIIDDELKKGRTACFNGKKFQYFNDEITSMWECDPIPAKAWPNFSGMQTIKIERGNHFNSGIIDSMELLRDKEGKLWAIFGGGVRIQEVRHAN